MCATRQELCPLSIHAEEEQQKDFDIEEDTP